MTLAADAPIDGLVPIDPPNTPPDCRVVFTSPDPRPTAAGSIVLDYADGTSFVIDREARNIWCTRTVESTDADTATYLLGPVLAYALRLRGALALHASGIVTHNGAVLIAGPPGAGKSTTAALFARRGATVVTDDVAAITWRDGAAFVQPGYPRVRLWPDVAETFWGAADALPLLTPTWAKRFAEVAIVDEPQRIHAVCVLSGRAAEPVVREVNGADAAIALLRHASMTHALDDSMRERELADVARLASTVRVFEVITPDDLRKASEVVENIDGCVLRTE